VQSLCFMTFTGDLVVPKRYVFGAVRLVLTSSNWWLDGLSWNWKEWIVDDLVESVSGEWLVVVTVL